MDDIHNSHQTVLLEDAVQAVLTDNDGVYIDGTFGRGGHGKLILEHLSNSGQLWGFDKDHQAVVSGTVLAKLDERFHMLHDSFANMNTYFLPNSVDGVLLDLGVSSPQLDEPTRGFSFLRDGPLDMRMNKCEGMTAAEWISDADEKEIREVLWEYGEERYARRIARAIVRERQDTQFKTTKQLANVIASASYSKEKKHPATRSFQAIRIHINRELDDLSNGLNSVLKVMKSGGKLVVISFHSLEDRIVKRFIRKYEQGDFYPKDFPITEEMKNRQLKKIGRVIKPSSHEVNNNPRARSAVMRVAQKI